MSWPAKGSATASHPVTGEKKVEKESILAFARRHGWDVVTEGSQDDYYHSAQLRKGDERLSISFWPGRSHAIALATGGTGAAFMEIPEPRRERVERFLLGVPCICPEQPDVVGVYERKPDSGCPIHGVES